MHAEHADGPLARDTNAHLERLVAELRAEKVQLNTKGEASLSLEHIGHRLELTLAVSEEVRVVVMQSYVGTVVDEDRLPEVAMLLGTVNLSVADTGGTAFAVLPTSRRIYSTYGLVGKVPYESFRAAFARLVEVTSAWRGRIAGDVELAGVVRVESVAP